MISRPIQVAILDDDPSVRIALARLLKAADMPADAYATSDELFAAVAAKSYDLLLLDLQMPGTDGVDVLNQLRQRGVRTPAIVVTGSDWASSRSDCSWPRAPKSYLSKPIDAAQLIQMIHEVSEAARSSVAASSN